jgi:hypothetical protein
MVGDKYMVTVVGWMVLESITRADGGVVKRTDGKKCIRTKVQITKKEDPHRCDADVENNLRVI